MTNNFIDKVAEQISDERSRKLITAELESHLLDKIDYYVDIGYSREDAEKRATEEMGDPYDTAVPLNYLHSHDNRRVVTWLFFAAVFVLFIISINAAVHFCYTADYSNLTHYVLFDFLSLGIIAAYVLMIMYSQKSNHKSVIIFIIVSLALQLLMTASSIILQESILIMINMTAIFQPASYAIITIFSKGPIAYIDSLFAYENIDYSIIYDWCYTIIPCLIMLLLLIWAVAVLVKINGNLKMESKKVHLTATRILKNTILIFLSVNFVVTGICAVVSRIAVNFKSDEFLAEKENIIEFVLNANLNNNDSQFLSSANENGLDFQLNYKYDRNVRNDPSYKNYVHNHNGNMVSATYDNSHISLEYSVLDTSIFFKDLLLTAKEIDTINNLKSGDSIDKLYESGIIYKTARISRSYYPEYEEDDYGIDPDKVKYHLSSSIEFVVKQKGQTYETIHLSISNGKIEGISEQIEYKKEYEKGFDLSIMR